MELVVVLLLLGILASILLPRFLNLSDQAFAAKMQALTGALQTAVASYHAAWRLSGADGNTIDVQQFGLGDLDANAFGYPVSGLRDQAAPTSDVDCVDLWIGLLDNGPTVARADPTKEQGTTIHHIEPKLGTGTEFVAGQDGVIDDAGIPISFASNSEVCQFISLEYQSVQPGTPKPTIYYDTRTGTVLLDLARVF